MAISKNKVKVSSYGIVDAAMDVDPSGVTRFDVEVTTSSTDEFVHSFKGIIAQTRAEAVNKAKQKLTFSAERA